MTSSPSSRFLDPTKIVNVFVHGLFFMRLGAEGTTLELIVPSISTSPQHQFLGGVRKQLQRLNGQVQWTNIGLIGKTITQPPVGQMPPDIPSSIPQFSISKTGLQGFNESMFAGIVFLPWPLDFFSVRCDNFDSTFLFDPTKPIIGADIKQHCRGTDPNAQVGFITCLQYMFDTGVTLPSWSPGMNLHIYFEPCRKHTIDEVNQDLAEAAQIFLAPNNFDIQMQPSAGAHTTIRGSMCKRIPPGFNKDDDFSMHEDPEPKSQGFCPKADATAGALNPANCPNFFVGS